MRTIAPAAVRRAVTGFAMLIVSGACMTSALGAQPSSPLAGGARVRVSAPSLGKGKHIASVVSTSSDTLVVRLAGKSETVALRAGDLRSLDRSTGTRTRFWKGFFLGTTAGAALGAGIGAIVPLSSNTVCYRSVDQRERIPCDRQQLRDDMIAFGLMTVGGIGEVVGGIVGWRSRTDRWQRVQQSDWATRVSITPSQNRGVGVSVAF